MKERAKKPVEKRTDRAVKAAPLSLPKFSFIIPAFVTEQAPGTLLALGRCWKSILDQTDTSWEVVLVHDGPSELCRTFSLGMKEDCREYGLFPNRVKYIEAPYVGQRGGHQSVNVAMELCEGEFVTILNGDNTLRPHYCESMYDENADILMGSVLMNDNRGNILTGRAFTRGHIDRLNYSIRAGIARSVRHKQHMDADFDFLLTCWTTRNETAPVRMKWVEAVVAEHN